MERYIVLALLAVASYFIGSFNAAINISMYYHKKDIRKYGSGNAGTTNMLRTFGPVLGTMTFCADIIKGALSSFLGMLPGIIWNDPDLSKIGCMLCGIIAVVGHIWPIYYHFKGGKGIACTIGCFLLVDPLFTLILFALAVVSVLLFHYVSVASMAGTFVFAVYLTVRNWGKPLFWYSLAFGLIIWILAMISHKENIARLRAGTEKRINLLKLFSKKESKEEKN